MNILAREERRCKYNILHSKSSLLIPKSRKKRRKMKLCCLRKKTIGIKEQIGFHGTYWSRWKGKKQSTMKGILVLIHKSWTATQWLQAQIFMWEGFIRVHKTKLVGLLWPQVWTHASKQPVVLYRTNTKQKFHYHQDVVHGVSNTWKMPDWNNTWKLPVWNNTWRQHIQVIDFVSLGQDRCLVQGRIQTSPKTLELDTSLESICYTFHLRHVVSNSFFSLLRIMIILYKEPFLFISYKEPFFSCTPIDHVWD